MRLVRPTLAFALLTAAVAACSDRAGPSEPTTHPQLIVNGTPTGNLYPTVGALLFDYDKNGIDGDDEWCTGSLIGPTVFLTAAHCVVTSYTPPGTQFYVSFASDLYAKSAKFIKATGYVYDARYGHDQANLY